MTAETEKKIVNRMSFVNFAGDIFLAIFKAIAGVLGGSVAMLSDATHSLSHVFTTLIAFIGAKAGERKPDKAHPYGHDRLECLASSILGLTLLAASFEIGWTGITTLISRSYLTTAVPGLIALAGAISSILCNEVMYAYTKRGAIKIRSTAFMANAKHLRSDALSSVGALIGILGARFGFPAMDAIASLVICLFLFQSAYSILKDAVDKILDTSCGETYEKDLCDFIVAQDGVKGIDLLHTRMFGDKVYVDAEIDLDGEQSLEQAHGIAETVHQEVERNFPEVKHIMIHENPT